jgi:hypothetical protein
MCKGYDPYQGCSSGEAVLSLRDETREGREGRPGEGTLLAEDHSTCPQRHPRVGEMTGARRRPYAGPRCKVYTVSPWIHGGKGFAGIQMR